MLAATLAPSTVSPSPITSSAPLSTSAPASTTSSSSSSSSSSSWADQLLAPAAFPALGYEPVFDHDHLRSRLQAFVLRFDDYIRERKDALTHAKRLHQIAVQEETEKITEARKQLAELKVKREDLQKTLQLEKQQVEEAQQCIEGLTERKDQVETRREELRKLVEKTREALDHKKEAKATRDRALAQEGQKNAPELATWEELLAMKINGVGSQRISFCFTHIDEMDWNAEYMFAIQMSEVYQVVECQPEVPHLREMERELNVTRDFYRFLKLMRQAFLDHSKRTMRT